MLVNEKLKTVLVFILFQMPINLKKTTDVVKDAIAKMINEDTKTTFKINTKRSDKTFQKVTKTLAENCRTCFHHVDRQLKVDVHHPEMLDYS